jgi:hypothetical protein
MFHYNRRSAVVHHAAKFSGGTTRNTSISLGWLRLHMYPLHPRSSTGEFQRQALTRADPSIRGQLLGRALHGVRYNPYLLFRFLSENVPAFARVILSFLLGRSETRELDAAPVFICCPAMNGRLTGSSILLVTVCLKTISSQDTSSPGIHKAMPALV